MKKHLIISAISFITSSGLWTANSYSQVPEIDWQNTIGGTSTDNLQVGFQTSGGDYFIAGTSFSNISGDKTENDLGLVHGDYWILKLNSSGNIIWQNTIGGSNTEILYAAIETTDGGYLLGGHSFSGFTHDKTEAVIGGQDYWVVKIDNLGNVVWNNTIGGTANDYLYDLLQTSDGGYMIGGYSESGVSGDKSEPCLGGLYYGDYWIVKLDGSGVVEWDKTYKGEWKDELFEIVQTVDEGYLIGGQSNSGISGDKTESSNGGEDFWVIKTDNIGEIEWQKSIGGNLGDILKDLKQTIDGGYILGGYSNSGISGYKTEANHGPTAYFDYWIVKIDEAGILEWENTIGGSGNDVLQSILQTIEGGFILGGYSDSEISGDKSEAAIDFSKDYWIVKLSNEGITEWQNTIGGDEDDELNSVSQTSDFGFFLTGTSESGISGDKTENRWGFTDDYWVVKLFTDCIPAPELCNTLDDNCNGLIDDGIIETISISAGGATTFCQGGNVLLSAIYTGATVQWKKNDINIPGAIAANYAATKSGTYTCVTTSPCGVATSTGILVTVKSNPPAAITAGGATTFCMGGLVVLTANAGGGLSYQWYKGAAAISGATLINYTATLPGNYKCKVTKTATGCFKNSNVIVVSVPCKEDQFPLGGLGGQMLIFPNPASDKLSITLTSSNPLHLFDPLYLFTITDITGKTISTFEITSSTMEIDISNYAAGMYFINVNIEGKELIEKFIKE